MRKINMRKILNQKKNRLEKRKIKQGPCIER